MIYKTPPLLFVFFWPQFLPFFILLDFPGGSDSKASAYNEADPGSIPALGISPGEGNGNPLQYSCLENPRDRGSWQATVHGVAKSETQLHFHFHFHLAYSALVTQSPLLFMNKPGEFPLDFSSFSLEMLSSHIYEWLPPFFMSLPQISLAH